MTLRQLQQIIQQSGNIIFDYGLSDPFCWRGTSYEVCFSVIKGEYNKQKLLDVIDKALNNRFYDNYSYDNYYYYDLDTKVHFEEDFMHYTNGKYCKEIISEIEPTYNDNEEKLSHLMFD